MLFNLHWNIICWNVCKGRSNDFRELALCCEVIVNCVIGGWRGRGEFNFVNLNWGGTFVLECDLTSLFFISRTVKRTPRDIMKFNPYS